MAENVIVIKKNKHPKKPLDNFDYEKEELYQTSYFDYIANYKNGLDKKQHNIILNYISPILSLKFVERYPKNVQKMINDFDFDLKGDEKVLFNKLDGKETKVNYIFKKSFCEFQMDKEKVGFEQAIDNNIDFYFLCEELYRSLPLSFVFSLIDIVGDLKNEC